MDTAPTTPSSLPGRALGSRTLALVVFALSLTATSLVTLHVHRTMEARDRARFERSVQETLDLVRGQLATHRAILEGASGLFAASGGRVSAEAFAAYVERLDLEHRYAGVQGLGFARRVAARDLPEFEAEVRRGRPTYHVWPEAGQAEVHAIEYLEPGARPEGPGGEPAELAGGAGGDVAREQSNLAAFGFDITSDPVRRAAAEAARDQGTAALSGKIVLVQDLGAEQPGFLMFEPVYRTGTVPATVEGRREALLGFVYGAFRAGDLFRSVFGEGGPEQVALEVFDGEPRTADGADDRVLYRSPSRGEARFVVDQPLTIAGRSWTVRVSSRPQLDFPLVPTLVVAGVLVSLALWGTLLIEARRRLRAEENARRLRRSRRALAATEQRLRTLIERLPVAVFVWRGHRLVYVNPALVDMLGYDLPDELVGRDPRELLGAEERERFWALVESTMKTGGQAPLKARPKKRDGGEIVAEGFLLAIELDAQPAVMGVWVDQTEQSQLITRMAQMDRMIAVGALAAGVAHEINNPLSYVLANLDFLKERIDELAEGGSSAAEVAELKSAVADAVDGASRVRQVVRSLKSLSRVDGETRQRLDVHAVLETSIKIAWNEIRHSARLERRYGEIAAVEANEARLGQVFLNLLLNAAQSIPVGAFEDNTITITTRMVDGGPAGAEPRPAARIAVEIADTGCGIEPANLRRIFDPFFTTKPLGVGTGLGLSICQSIVTGFGGEISVTSAPGEGSLFTVLLPAAEAQVTAGAAALPAPPKAPRLRVLVIDDEENVGRVLVRLLGTAHEVSVETSARVAARRIAEGERFDLILCDLMMPDMTGMDFYAAIAPHSEVVERVVFMTGDAFTQAAREFLASVPNRKLDKPFDFELIRRMMAELGRATPSEATASAQVS